MKDEDYNIGIYEMKDEDYIIQNYEVKIQDYYRNILKQEKKGVIYENEREQNNIPIFAPEIQWISSPNPGFYTQTQTG